jgi:hypothetical protein
MSGHCTEEISEVARLHLLRNGQCTTDGRHLESYHLQDRIQHICTRMVTPRKKLNEHSIVRAHKVSARTNHCLRQGALVVQACGSHVLTLHIGSFSDLTRDDLTGFLLLKTYITCSTLGFDHLYISCASDETILQPTTLEYSNVEWCIAHFLE